MKIPSRPWLVLLFAAVFTAAATAAERVALVIGNNAYQNGTPLKNCVNDARVVAAGLKSCGFEVTMVEDCGLAVFEEKLRAFRAAASGAKAAWFYYAGHGIEVKGSNYLIPVDAAVKEEFEVKHKTLALDMVLGAMEEAGTPLKVVVLDCCRDNPFGRGWSRSGSVGLAQVAGTPKGTIIAYATAPGTTAEDGKDGNSPYSRALAAALAKPGLDIDQVFKETGRAVVAVTAEKQIPWKSSSYNGDFLMRPGAAVRPAVPAEPAEPAAPPIVKDDPIIAAMKRSLRAGEIKELSEDQVIKFEEGPKETVEGVAYQTGIATYRAETIFGIKDIQALALIRNNRVEKWIWKTSRIEIK